MILRTLISLLLTVALTGGTLLSTGVQALAAPAEQEQSSRGGIEQTDRTPSYSDHLSVHFAVVTMPVRLPGLQLPELPGAPFIPLSSVRLPSVRHSDPAPHSPPYMADANHRRYLRLSVLRI